MARSTLRRTRRRTNRRRLQRGGEGQRQVEEELMRCKERVEYLEKLLSSLKGQKFNNDSDFHLLGHAGLPFSRAPGNLRGHQHSGVPTHLLPGERYQNTGPSSFDKKYLREQEEIIKAQERRRLEREKAFARISPEAHLPEPQPGPQPGPQPEPQPEPQPRVAWPESNPDLSQFRVSASERRSMENERRSREDTLGLAVPKDKKMSRSEPEEMVMFNGRMVPKFAVDRLKYYQDKAANSTPAELKAFKKSQMKEKRWRSSQGLSGKSKSRYRARP